MDSGCPMGGPCLHCRRGLFGEEPLPSPARSTPSPGEKIQANWGGAPLLCPSSANLKPFHTAAVTFRITGPPCRTILAAMSMIRLRTVVA